MTNLYNTAQKLTCGILIETSCSQRISQGPTDLQSSSHSRNLCRTAATYDEAKHFNTEFIHKIDPWFISKSQSEI